MGVPMPPVVVLVVCKVILGQPDDNSQFTHWRQSEWDMTQGVMHCRRQEIQLYDKAADQGADPVPFTTMACNRAGITLGTQFDIENENKPWRYRKHGCPVPVINTQTGEIIAWKMPECGTEDGTVICEQDTEI